MSEKRLLPRPGGGNRRLVTVCLPLLGALLLSLVMGAAFGAVDLSPVEILKIAAGKIGLSHSPVSPGHEDILLQIRLPRVVAAALVGAALAVAGVLFQGLLRNPLADPYIIGTSAGAGLGATIALMIPSGLAFFSLGLVPVAAFFGALATVLLVYNLARIGGRASVITLLLAGFVVSSMLVAAMMFLILVADPLQLRLRAALSFLMGGISVRSWGQTAVVALVVSTGIILARFFSLRLNAFSLGEEGAAYVGVEVERDKFRILALGSLLTAAAVSLGGLIGFVGLVVPHALRLVLGPDHRLLLPASALAGGTFLVIADLLARTLRAPTEIPVGVLTALVGAPFFLYLLRRSKKRYAF